MFLKCFKDTEVQNKFLKAVALTYFLNKFTYKKKIVFQKFTSVLRVPFSSIFPYLLVLYQVIITKTKCAVRKSLMSLCAVYIVTSIMLRMCIRKGNGRIRGLKPYYN